MAREVAINLDRDDATRTFRQTIGQGASTRTDLDYHTVGKRTNRIDNRIQHVIVAQKMLTKSLPWRWQLMLLKSAWRFTGAHHAPAIRMSNERS